MLSQLHITAVRPGATGNDPKAANAANYDEAKANPYPQLPDALTFKNNKKVETGLMDGGISFRQHSAGHTPVPNRPFFLDFAARYFK